MVRIKGEKVLIQQQSLHVGYSGIFKTMTVMCSTETGLVYFSSQNSAGFLPAPVLTNGSSKSQKIIVILSE